MIYGSKALFQGHYKHILHMLNTKYMLMYVYGVKLSLFSYEIREYKEVRANVHIFLVSV